MESIKEHFKEWGIIYIIVVVSTLIFQSLARQSYDGFMWYVAVYFVVAISVYVGQEKEKKENTTVSNAMAKFKKIGTLRDRIKDNKE